MRRLFTFCLLCLWASRSWGQASTAFPVDPTTHRIRYTGLVPVPDRRQADLLASAQAWAQAISTPDKPAVNTRVSDAERLVVQGTQPFSYTYRYIRPQQAASLPSTTPSGWCYTTPPCCPCRRDATPMM